MKRVQESSGQDGWPPMLLIQAPTVFRALLSSGLLVSWGFIISQQILMGLRRSPSEKQKVNHKPLFQVFGACLDVATEGAVRLLWVWDVQADLQFVHLAVA